MAADKTIGARHLAHGKGRANGQFNATLAEHDLFGKPVATFPDHALWRSMIFSENRLPLFRIML
jgi:hypothetical protein